MAAEYQRRTGTEIPPPPAPSGPSIQFDPTGTVPFTWSCKCGNVEVDGRVKEDQENCIREAKPERAAEGSAPSSQDMVKVWIDQRREHISAPKADDLQRQARYVIYDVTPEERGRIRTPSYYTGCWRLCMLCETKLYKVTEEVGRNDEGAVSQWVDVDLSSTIAYGSSLTELGKEKSLPFSGLRLPLESQQSNFGKPQPTTVPPIYPPQDLNPTPPGLLSTRIKGLIPTIHDPFFLPPPFIPSHPHLRDLCKESVAYLQEVQHRHEEDIQTYIQGKANEMRKLEEVVRCEVEMLWHKYLETNAEAREVTTRRRGSKVDSRSKSRETIRKFSPSPNASYRKPINFGPELKTSSGNSAAGPSSVNPIADLASREPAYSAPSLISASITANAHRAPPPPVQPKDQAASNNMDDEIASVEQKYDKKSVQREVVMSHVFSTLDANMANKARGSNPSFAVLKEPTPAAIHAAKARASASRSRSRERALKGVAKEPPIEEEAAGSSRKPSPQPEAPAYNRRRSVKFDEPEIIDDAATRAAQVRDNQDGEVFDFELEEGPPPQMSEPVGYSLDPNHVDEEAAPGYTDEADLLAASAPSHRAAWTRSETTGNLRWFDKLAKDRRSLQPPDGDSADDRNDDSTPSTLTLATSMPVTIVAPEKRKVVGFASPDLERKTSLSEKEGKLVPPLRSAMRQRGASGSGSGAGTAEQQGSYFVPPHIQIREEDRAKKMGASRSIYDK